MRQVSLGVLLLLTALSGCLQDDDDDPLPPVPVGDLLAGPALWTDPQNAPHKAYGWPTLSNPAVEGAPDFWSAIPAAELPATIKGIAPLAKSPADVKSGAGMALFGSIAFVPGFGAESYILNISDPSAPTLLSIIRPESAHRGAAFVAYPDGRLVAAVSTGQGFDVINVTDPTKPEILTSVKPTQGGHKLGIVPGTPILYNAASDGGGDVRGGKPAIFAEDGKGVTEIYDLSDPAAPAHVQDFPNGYSCHHVYFWSDATNDKYRATCAGIEFAQIWDIDDPKDPKVIASVPIPLGAKGAPSLGTAIAAPWSHFAVLSQDGKTLIVGDESGGGSLPPGCVAGAHTGDRSLSTPIGALWFYDVSVEDEPQLKGWFSPGQHFTQHQKAMSCTAHHGRIVPQEGRDLLAMGFYGAGTVLVDFTDPQLPFLVDQFSDGTDTWEVWYNQGYLFTGDLARGMDVLKFE